MTSKMKILVVCVAMGEYCQLAYSEYVKLMMALKI